MYKATISEIYGEAVGRPDYIVGLGVQIEPPIHITREDVIEVFGDDRVELSDSPHQFPSHGIGPVEATDESERFALVRTEVDFGGLYFGHEGSSIVDGAKWAASYLIATLFVKKGYDVEELVIDDNRNLKSSVFVALPEWWRAERQSE